LTRQRSSPRRPPSHSRPRRRRSRSKTGCPSGSRGTRPS
jgi:hypothetical protein